MIEGWLSSEGEPSVKVTLVGVNKSEVEIDAAIDTGFNGHLSLPLARILSLGWRLGYKDYARLGDGSNPVVEIYRGLVMWHGQPRLVFVMAAESPAVIGTDLLYGNELKIQFKAGGSVSVSPLP